MIKVSTVVSLTFLILGLITGTYSWNYEGNQDADGISHWGEHYPKCDGLKQSPINIDTSKVKVNHNLTLQLNGLDVLHKSHIKNNGHSVQLELLDTPKPNLTGSVVHGKTYEFAQLHFHWGKKSDRGSEHSIDSVFFPEEMHMVFYRKKYGDFESASKFKDGLVVLGVFLKNSTYFNHNFDPLILAVHQARQFDSLVNLSRDITFRQLLPKNLLKFYRYPGSLTTPPCDENVTWILLAETIDIGEKQLEIFRHEKTNHVSADTGTNEIDHNYRYQAPVNGRIVQASFDP